MKRERRNCGSHGAWTRLSSWSHVPLSQGDFHRWMSCPMKRERVTFYHLPFQIKWLYVGTRRGSIPIVNMEAFSLSSHIIMWNKAIELLSKSHPGPVVHISDSPMDERKELCTWEEELMWAALQQKNLEELLWRREQELAEQEIDILGWELNIILHQLCQEKPQLKKHVGKFRKKSWLKIKDGNRISLPSGQWPGACWKLGKMQRNMKL
ncbi:uncharacterized protein LOC143673216 isoform X3 [Tamandua tetradactyla]|uniref:uncharacterized protein LOC143673216 isoform X3 n=1 Tax=Tamandua tetradactyla TaxID=48850 RepID=UPI0040542A2E